MRIEQAGAIGENARSARPLKVFATEGARILSEILDESEKQIA
jgi:hypothetical protein